MRKIDEVYGRWTRTPAARMLDLDDLCAEVMSVLAGSQPRRKVAQFGHIAKAKGAPEGEQWPKIKDNLSAMLPRPGVEPGLEVPETSVMSFSLPGQRQSHFNYRTARCFTSSRALSRGAVGQSVLSTRDSGRPHRLC